MLALATSPPSEVVFGAAFVLGVGLGAVVGYLVKVLVVRSPDVGELVTNARKLLLLAFGAGSVVASAALFAALSEHGGWIAYGAGLGFGLIGGLLGRVPPAPAPPPAMTRQQVEQILLMSEGLRARGTTDPWRQATLILSALVGPDGIERAEGVSDQELAEDLEQSLDDE